MQKIKSFESANGKIATTAKTFPEDADLSTLIDHAISDENPVVIVDEKDKRVGVITRADLLRTVIEGTETS